MIVTFKSKASGNIIYFKDVALKLLALMGRDNKVPSALFAEDVAPALAQLQQKLVEIEAEEQQKAELADADEMNTAAKKPYISLIIRATPLVELLQRAAKKQCPVQWE